jgi:Uma2 family endonuclease
LPVKTVVLGERPAELEAFLERRRALGQDGYDEVWQGVYHVAPMAHAWHGYLDNLLAERLGPLARAAGLVGTSAFNLGDPDDYRVPDRGYHLALPSEVRIPTAALVVEVISPDDETWTKFDFYARHHVDEICTADPIVRELRWFILAGDAYRETDRSQLLGVSVAALAEEIEWPAST